MAKGSNGARGLSRRVERRLKEIAACARRGESLKAYAQRTGQSVYPLYEAKRQARRAGVLAPHRNGKRRSETGRQAGGAGRFVQAVISTPTPTPAPTPEARPSAPRVAWRLRLPGGAVLESAAPLEAALLERVVTGLGGGA